MLRNAVQARAATREAHSEAKSSTLAALRPGQQGIITQIRAEGAIKRRLVDMGLTPGTIVYIRKKAPLGDPIEINLRGYELTLRANEASNIHIRM